MPIEMTYTTADGRTFTDEAAAKAHNAVLEDVQAWLDANEIADTKRHHKRDLLVAYATRNTDAAQS